MKENLTNMMKELNMVFGDDLSLKKLNDEYILECNSEDITRSDEKLNTIFEICYKHVGEEFMRDNLSVIDKFALEKFQ